MVAEKIDIRFGGGLPLHQCRHNLIGIYGGTGEIFIGNPEGGTQHKGIGIRHQAT